MLSGINGGVSFYAFEKQGAFFPQRFPIQLNPAIHTNTGEAQAQSLANQEARADTNVAWRQSHVRQA